MSNTFERDIDSVVKLGQAYKECQHIINLLTESKNGQFLYKASTCTLFALPFQDEIKALVVNFYKNNLDALEREICLYFRQEGER